VPYKPKGGSESGYKVESRQAMYKLQNQLFVMYCCVCASLWTASLLDHNHGLLQWCTTSSPQATSGPRRVVKWPAVSSRKCDYFRIRTAENARRKPSWILFRHSGLRIQDETEVLPTASRLRTFYSFRYFLVTHVAATNQCIDTQHYMYIRMSEPLSVIFCHFKDFGQCGQHTQVYADPFVVIPMD